MQIQATTYRSDVTDSSTGESRARFSTTDAEVNREVFEHAPPRALLCHMLMVLCACGGFAAGTPTQAQSVARPMIVVAASLTDARVAAASEARPVSATASNLADALALAKQYQSNCVVGGVDIVLALKLLRLESAIVIDERNSGSPDCPLTIRSATGWNARITGSVSVTDWQNDIGPRANELSEAARGKVVAVDLTALQIPYSSDWAARGHYWPLRPAIFEVFVGGLRVPAARWPNTGYAQIASVENTPWRNSFVLDAVRAQRWSGERLFKAVGYWKYDYSYESHPARLTAPREGVIALLGNGPRYGIAVGKRVFVSGVLAELDMVGEWYFDHDGRKLLIWPPSADPSRAHIELSKAETLLRFDGASHVVLRDLHLDMSTGDTIVVNKGTGVVIENNVVTQSGNRAINIREGTKHRISGNRIYRTGEGGVTVTAGDRQRLIRSEHQITRNHFSRTSDVIHTYRPAVFIDGVGTSVIENLFEDLEHHAVGFQGNEHLIEGNTFRRTVTETSDSGIVYTGRDWTARGTIIRNNTFFGARPYAGADTKGVYLDDQASGITVTGNTFVCVSGAVFLGGGNDNLVAQNVFIASSPPVYLDDRGLNWQREGWADPNSTLQKRLRAVPYDGSVYRSRYPGLAGILTDEPGKPKRNIVEGNVLLRSGPPWYYEGAIETNELREFKVAPLGDPRLGSTEQVCNNIDNATITAALMEVIRSSKNALK